ncbi:hypothetical protein B0H14DRAFT_2635945 [Mycena olivaceomarginata]|nr:hypothetical protein B0H14DRAFT_2635945 [Mycena olivaceomarginata]
MAGMEGTHGKLFWFSHTTLSGALVAPPHLLSSRRHSTLIAWIAAHIYFVWSPDLAAHFGLVDPNFSDVEYDKVVLYPDSKAMFEKLPAKDKKMITYPGGYHELHFEPDGIREKSLQDLVEFIHTHV